MLVNHASDEKRSVVGSRAGIRLEATASGVIKLATLLFLRSAVTIDNGV
jgi:hypothetical protein